METMESYKKNLVAQLNEWIAQIKLLDAKAGNAEAGEKLRYLRDLDVMHAKRREVAGKIKALENAGDDSWESVKVTAEEFWDTYRRSSDKAVFTAK